MVAPITTKCLVTDDNVEQDGLMVLVIDDQRTMRRIVRDLLKQIGITHVEEASNGKAALDFIDKGGTKTPDVVICDLHMDKMDGLEFCNKLRLSRQDDVRQIPVIVLTGDSDNLMLEVTAQIGVLAILSKPVSAPVLQDTISKAVGFSIGITDR